jgi:hypothetical protein
MSNRAVRVRCEAVVSGGWLIRLGMVVAALVIGVEGCKAAAGNRASGDEGRLHAEMGSVLSQSAVPGLLADCSQGEPKGIEYWAPTREDLDALERGLQPVLQEAIRRASPGDGAPLKAEDYYRQYVGIIRNGKRLIHVSGFHRDYARSVAGIHSQGASGDTLRWRTVPISACDGGTMFFSVEYDPRKHSFTRVRFNGRAG